MGFIPAIQSGFKNCFKFTGRASRSEFWWFYLFFILSIFVCCIVSAVLGGVIRSVSPAGSVDIAADVVLGLLGLTFLAMFFPILSLIFRRLHDSDKSAWLVLLYLVPLGGLVLFVFYLLPGTEGPNPHGDNPLRPVEIFANTF